MMSTDIDHGVNMRTLGVKKRLAQEFIGLALSEADFKALFPAATKDKASYHRAYTGQEIRAARLALARASEVVKPTSNPPVICTRTPKGGAGKTTIVSNVGSTLAMMGYRVLMIDGDPQGSLSQIFGLNWMTDKFTHIGELLKTFCTSKESPPFEKAVRSLYPGVLDLIPADITMAGTDLWMVGQPYRESLIKRMMETHTEFFGRYDVILIDTAPSTSLLTLGLMVAAEQLLVVARLEPQCVATLQQLISNVDELESAGAGKFDIHVVANGYVPPSHPMFGSVEQAVKKLMEEFPGLIDDCVLSLSPPFMRQMDLYLPNESGTVIEREPNTTACRQVVDLAKSLIARYNIRLAGVGQFMGNKAA